MSEIIKSIEGNIEHLIKTGLPDNHVYWLSTVVSPRDRKASEKNSSELQLLLSGIFQYKFKEWNPKFLIGWDRHQKAYRIGIHEFKRVSPSQELETQLTV